MLYVKPLERFQTIVRLLVYKLCYIASILASYLRFGNKLLPSLPAYRLRWLHRSLHLTARLSRLHGNASGDSHCIHSIIGKFKYLCRAYGNLLRLPAMHPVSWYRPVIILYHPYINSAAVLVERCPCATAVYMYLHDEFDVRVDGDCRWGLLTIL